MPGGRDRLRRMPTIGLNGFQMYYEVRRGGEPLLLLHGGMGIGGDWRHVFPSDPEGYGVIVPDLRGHGRSTNPAREFTFRQCANQIRQLYDMTRAFATSYDDMAFTPPQLGSITARTLIVHGDRDPLYPVELALELFRGIPRSALWIIPYGAHGPIFGAMAPPFTAVALAHLSGQVTS
jgi:pimeloyl-ACP methyl ester carboxylesterase